MIGIALVPEFCIILRYATRENGETWEMTKQMSIQINPRATELKASRLVTVIESCSFFQVRGQFDKARVTWESKERELEVQAPALLFESLHFYHIP